MSAYTCLPNRGSEPGVGWRWSVQAAAHNEIWVLTRSANRMSLLSYLEDNHIRDLNFIFFDIPFSHYLFSKGRLGESFHYIIWQLFAPFVVSLASRSYHISFDVVHHLNFNTIDIPGFLWLLRRPFVWGPVGAGQVPPSSFSEYFPHSWASEVRRRRRKSLLRFSPYHRAAAKSAYCILVANGDTEAILRNMNSRWLIRELEIGVDSAPLLNFPGPERRVGFPVHLGWAGSLTENKAPLLAIQIVERLVDLGTPVVLSIAGSGPLEGELCSYIDEKSLTNQVQLRGALSHQEMNTFYQELDFFLFSSLRDTSGNVALEALANGVPVIALRHQGVADIVSPESGVLIDVTDPQAFIAAAVAAIQELAFDESRYSAMARGAYDRAHRQLSNERLAPLLKQIYAAARFAHTPKPTQSFFERMATICQSLGRLKTKH